LAGVDLALASRRRRHHPAITTRQSWRVANSGVAGCVNTRRAANTGTHQRNAQT